MNQEGVQVKQKDISKKEREDLKKFFNRLDDNGDGKVSKFELSRAIKRHCKNLTKKDMKEIMAQVDKNGDGYMSYKEFERIMIGVTIDIDYENEMLRSAFEKFDLNGDGFISKEELKTILTKMGSGMPEEEAETMVLEADLNGDGKISYEEFKLISGGGGGDGL